MSRQPPNGNIVYSTDPEPIQPQPSAPPPPTNQQTARIWRDRKRRRGKTVTIIDGIQGSDVVLDELLRSLKKQLGTGGTLKDGELEIQGDHRDTLATLLGKLGYKVKLVGG